MIEVYTTPTCVYCHALISWLDEQGIKYIEKDASEDPTITGVPVSRIEQEDSTVVEVIGFDRMGIRDALVHAK